MVIWFAVRSDCHQLKLIRKNYLDNSKIFWSKNESIAFWKNFFIGSSERDKFFGNKFYIDIDCLLHTSRIFDFVEPMRFFMYPLRINFTHYRGQMDTVKLARYWEEIIVQDDFPLGKLLSSYSLCFYVIFDYVSRFARRAYISVVQLSVLIHQSRYFCERADFGKIYNLYGVLI